jgi:hypothetical protein
MTSSSTSARAVVPAQLELHTLSVHETLDFKQRLICILVSLSIIVVSEIQKAILRRRRSEATPAAVVAPRAAPA